MGTDINPLDKEPAEGSRETIEKELRRQDGARGKTGPSGKQPSEGGAVGAPKEKPVMDSTRGLP
jgi:hypothetical protein